MPVILGITLFGVIEIVVVSVAGIIILIAGWYGLIRYKSPDIKDDEYMQFLNSHWKDVKTINAEANEKYCKGQILGGIPYAHTLRGLHMLQERGLVVGHLRMLHKPEGQRVMVHEYRIKA